MDICRFGMLSRQRTGDLVGVMVGRYFNICTVLNIYYKMFGKSGFYTPQLHRMFMSLDF